MPLNLIIDATDARKRSILSSFLSAGLAPYHEFFLGDLHLPITIRPVVPSDDATRPFDDDHVTGDTYKFTIGLFDEPPSSGTFALSIDGNSTGMTALAYNATAAALQTVLSAAAVVEGFPAIAVIKLASGVYQIDGLTSGAIPAIVADASQLHPVTTATVSMIAAGSVSTKAQQIIFFRQDAVAYATPATELPAASVTVSTEQAADSTHNKIVRISFTEGTYGGAFSISITAQGITEACGIVDANASAVDMGNALASHSRISYELSLAGTTRNNIVVLKDGTDFLIEFVSGLSGPEDPTLTAADVDLMAPAGVSGFVDLNTVNLAKQFYASEANELDFYLSVERTRASGENATLLMIPCTLHREIIATGALLSLTVEPGGGILSVIHDTTLSGLGTVASALGVNVGTSANQIVQLTAAAKLPAVDASLLTNLPAQNGVCVLFSGTASANYIPAADSDAARGTALLAAVTASAGATISSPKTIRVAAGTYGTSGSPITVTLPDYVFLEGAGCQASIVNGTMVRGDDSKPYNVKEITFTLSKDPLVTTQVHEFENTAANGVDFVNDFRLFNCRMRDDGTWNRLTAGTATRLAQEINWNPPGAPFALHEINFDIQPTGAAGTINFPYRLFHFQIGVGGERGSNVLYGDLGCDGNFYIQPSGGYEPYLFISNLTSGYRMMMTNAATALTKNYIGEEIAGLFITGRTYVITLVGTTTNWVALGASSGTIGVIFVAANAGSGDGQAMLLINAGSFVAGTDYEIAVAGTTDFNVLGAANNSVGTYFRSQGVGTGTGRAYRLYKEAGVRLAGGDNSDMAWSPWTKHGWIHQCLDKGKGMTVGTNGLLTYFTCLAPGTLALSKDDKGSQDGSLVLATINAESSVTSNEFRTPSSGGGYDSAFFSYGIPRNTFVDFSGDFHFRTDSDGVNVAAGGVYQVETATVVGTITLAGEARVTITAAGLPGSPIAIDFAVGLGDSAEAVAGWCRDAISSNVDVSSLYSAEGDPGGGGVSVILRALAQVANDPTLNIAIDNLSCDGLTPALTSVSTIAGSSSQIDAMILSAITGNLWLLGRITAPTMDLTNLPTSDPAVAGRLFKHRDAPSGAYLLMVSDG